MDVNQIKTQIEELKKTLKNALTEAENLNARADAVVDKGLDAIEQSKYSAPIVAGFSAFMLGMGGLIGYAARAFVG
ncbi:hypothetical protein [Nitrosospira sp. Nsp1]|uniref:hypothetical protein n=1 Tax=Nitrosospira sp. Nsp1 TaxID=136547 RepID=UPI00087E54B7|nr:hypothetical protein [Nitrosospira sp. Nsp1]SCX40515.1 hypothetical protein SAMN05720354_103123 [Nitrosospira sp. Nsp1]